MATVKRARFSITSIASFFSGPPRVTPAQTDAAQGHGGDAGDYIIPSDAPTHLRRNKTERTRLQGLVHVMSGTGADGDIDSDQGAGATPGRQVEKDVDRDASSGLMRMVRKIRVWMVNQGELALRLVFVLPTDQLTC